MRSLGEIKTILLARGYDEVDMGMSEEQIRQLYNRIGKKKDWLPKDSLQFFAKSRYDNFYNPDHV